MTLEECCDRYLLTMVLWRESRGEPDHVKTAVCYSILRRVQVGGWWGDTLQKVITKPWQYSSMSDPHDPQLVKYLISTDTAAKQCWDIAEGCLTNSLPNKFPKADSYFDQSIPPPAWATPATFLGKLGKINFHAVRG